MSTHAHICTVNTDSGLDWDLKCVDMFSDWGHSITSVIKNTPANYLKYFEI